MSVGSWEPESASAELTTDVLARLCRAAGDLEAPAFGLEPAEVDRLAPYARDGGPGSPVDWAAAAIALDDAQIVALVRLFTRAEMAFPGWKGADRSPVIALAALLKQRGAFPAGLTAWIRANSDNRFLPYGSLMRRL